MKKEGVGFNYVKNTSWVAVSHVLESLISYVIIVYISKYLGAEGLGQYSFIFSFASIFFIVADMGITGFLIKNIARDGLKKDRYISMAYRLRFLLSLVILGLFSLSLLFVGRDNLLVALFFVGVAQVFGRVFNVSQSLFRVQNKGFVLASVNLLERVISLFGALLILPYSNSITNFVVVLSLAKFIQMIVSYIIAKKYYHDVSGFDIKLTKRFFVEGFPFLLIGIFSVVYIQLDTVMLSFMKGDVPVGWYQAGYKLISLINFIPHMFLMFGFPLFARLVSQNKEAAKRLISYLVHLSYVIMFPLIVGSWFLGDRILEFIYTFDSPESVIAFRILIVAELFIFLTILLGHLIASDDQKRFAKIAGIGAGMNVVLNLLFIPTWSLYGAGMATLITYVLMLIMMLIDIRRNILSFFPLYKSWIPFIASCMMGVIIYLYAYLHLLWVLLISGGVYCFVLLCLYLLSSKPISLTTFKKTN